LLSPFALPPAGFQPIAQRLPQTVKPEHYTLTLAPDLKTATFTGKESIDVVVEQPSDVDHPQRRRDQVRERHDNR
jgi:hypothetical protein